MLAAWLGVAAFVIAGAPAAVGPAAAHHLRGPNASAQAGLTLMRAMAAHEAERSSFTAAARASALAESSAREDAAPVASRAVVAAPPATAPTARPPLLAGIVRKPRGGGREPLATFGARLTASAAHALSSPSINVSIQNDSINLEGWPAGATITLDVGGTERSVTVDLTGHAYVDRNLTGRDIVPDMTITASDGTTTQSLIVAHVTFDALDPATDVASGTAPPFASVGVGLNRGGVGLGGATAVADSTGNWSIDFGALGIDVLPYTSGGATVGDGDGNYTTAEFLVPSFSASLTRDAINLNEWPPTTSVTVTVDGAPFSVTTDGTGHAYLDRNHLGGRDLVPGTIVTASAGSVSKSLTLVDMSFDSLDPATNVAAGHAPANAQGWVNLNRGGINLATVNLAADSSGHWSADFSGVIDVQPGTTGNANVNDDDGDQTTAEFLVPTIDASLTHDSVNLNDWPAGSTVSVTAGGATHDVTVDSTGHAYLNSNTVGTGLVAGTTIDASGGGYSKSLTLVDVTFDSLDAATDVAAGHASPGSLVNVYLNRGGTGLGGVTTVADASGSWSADFSGVIDVQPGMTGSANVSDDDGDQTTGEFVIGRISTSLNNDWVNLDDWPGGSTVSLDVGGTDLSVPVDAIGHATVDRSVHGRDLVPGMVITATQGAVTKQLTLASISFDNLDPVTNIATGTAPPGSQVDVGINEGSTNFGNKDTTADSSGNWQVDFTGQIDITAGMHGFANVNDDDNDSTGVDWNPPQLSASLTSNWVQLNDWPTGTAVALDVAGTNISVTLDASGHAFVDSSLFGHKDLVPGMVITATQGAVTKQLTLLDMSFDTLDPATNVATGTAPPGSEVNVGINEGSTNFGNKQTTADSSGIWRVDFTGQIDITAGMNGYASISDVEDDQTAAEYFPPTAQVNVGENTFFQLQSPTADSVTTATSATSNENFQASVHNFNQAPIPAPTISLDGETATLTPAYTGGFPLTVTAPGDLQQGQELDLNTFCCQQNAPNLVTAGAHPGFDASRSGVLNTDGSVLTETVSVTLRDAAYGGSGVNANIDIQVLPQNQGSPSNGATIDASGAVLPTLGDGEQVQNNFGPPGSFEWNISGAVVGKTYTLTVPIDLNGLPGSSFKPNVSIGTGHSGNQVATAGSSATVHDADLGGTFTFSTAGGATVAWNAQTFKGFGVDFQAQGPPQLQASINTNLDASPGDPSVDSFAATDALAGQESWSAGICDFGNSGFFGTVAGLEITLPDARHDLDPPPAYPLHAGPTSLSQGNCFNLPGLEPPDSPPASISTSVTPTVDVSRSATPSDWTVPDGGGVMGVTVSVTPTTSDRSLDVHVGAADDNGDFWGTVDAANIVLPSGDIFNNTGNGPPCPPCANVFTNAGAFDWSTPYAIPGQTYTFVVPIDVPVGGTYKPHVHVTAVADAGPPLADVLASSTTIEDDGLGGTLSYSAGQIVDWQRHQNVFTTVSLDALAQPSTPPTSSTVNVAVVAPGGGPAAGAFVTACAGDAFGCRSATTDSSGNATITGATPAGTGLLHFTLVASTAAGVGYDGPFDLVPGGTASRTVTLVAPVPPPADVSITERGTTSDGIPVVSVHNPATLTATGCANGSASYTVARGSVVLASGSMTETPPGSGDYLAAGITPPPGDENGPATVTISVECGTDTQTIAFDIIYLDPSGVVVDQNGNPVAGATVTLLSAPSPDGPFTAVPDGSPVMSPDNRHNPDTTAADGTFGWDVVAGFYKVEATAPGCTPAQTGVLTVPPPVTGLVLTLDCNVDSTPPVVAVTGVASGADYLLGAVPAAGCSTTDALSGVATPASLTISGGPTGILTATCTGATDKAGNAAAPVSVSYVVATPLASKDTSCDGYYGGSGTTVTVAAGAVCTLIPGTQVSGNVQVSGALSDQGAAIGGNLQATGAAWVVVNGGSVGGNLQVQNLTSAPAGGDDALCNATVGGNVIVQFNGAGAPIDVGNLGACAGGAGLIIGGNLQVQSNAARVRAGGNSAHGNVIVQSNTGGGALTANSAGGNCLLQSNAPPIAGSLNTAAGPKNSCNATG